MVIIATSRLDLVPLGAEVLEAISEQDWIRAERYLGTNAALRWNNFAELCRRRYRQIREAPELEAWLLRAIYCREEHAIVGHIGFHTGPDPDYLLERGYGGVEFGYTVYPPYRRRGYATEAARGLMAWAEREHGVSAFVLSIAPDNAPSLAMAKRMRFRRVGEHIDPIDGLEHIFLRSKSPEPDDDAIT